MFKFKKDVKDIDNYTEDIMNADEPEEFVNLEDYDDSIDEDYKEAPMDENLFESESSMYEEDELEEFELDDEIDIDIEKINHQEPDPVQKTKIPIQQTEKETQSKGHSAYSVYEQCKSDLQNVTQTIRSRLQSLSTEQLLEIIELRFSDSDEERAFVCCIAKKEILNRIK